MGVPSTLLGLGLDEKSKRRMDLRTDGRVGKERAQRQLAGTLFRPAVVMINRSTPSRASHTSCNPFH